MAKYIVGGAIVVLIIGVIIWRARAPRKTSSFNVLNLLGVFGFLGSVFKRSGPASHKIDLNGFAESEVIDPALESSKLVIHSLLKSISDSVESLASENVRYDNSLEQHSAAVKKAMTLAGIKEIEKVLLGEVKQMQSANNQYRKQLDEANSKVKNQQQEMETLQADVGVDFLTKIPNRRSFDERVVEEMDRAKRYGTKFSLVVIDIDHFKMVNDTYGHLAGDKILRAIAGILDGQRRSSDFLARFGGEEFVMLLPETSVEDAKTAAERARSRIAESKFRLEKKSVRVTISAGVGELNPKLDTAQSLFSRVDSALYSAKDAGRNRVVVATLKTKSE